MNDLSKYIRISDEVVEALSGGFPVVALESTVITHGLPYPENFTLACDMEAEIENLGVIPATVALLDGVIHVGLDDTQLEHLASTKDSIKISTRDIAGALVRNRTGGTTVAGTLFIAQKVGIKVFATGGIGGVHRFPEYDISADLIQLAKTQMLVVCAGAKAILDLPATIEFLETFGIPVIGFQTDDFPAFYSKESGLKLNNRVDSPREVAKIANIHWMLQLQSGIIVAVPPPDNVALPQSEVQKFINQALEEANQANIRGQVLTPFLLTRVSELSEGSSMKSNLGLLRNNARVAAMIAKEMALS
jgi:pseudouridine-5'-phosphate glycosidase